MSLRAGRVQLAGELEGDRSSGAVSGDYHRLLPDELADLRCEISVLDTRQRLSLPIKPGGLQSIERMVEVLRDLAPAEHIAVVAGHGEDRGARPVLPQGHERPRLGCERLGGAQKVEDVGLPLPQAVAQLGGERSRAGIEAQGVTFVRDLDVPAAQLGHERGDAGKSGWDLEIGGSGGRTRTYTQLTCVA